MQRISKKVDVQFVKTTGLKALLEFSKWVLKKVKKGINELDAHDDEKNDEKTN